MLVALVLVALMIISAFVLDVGAVYNERRQDQSAADTGALAAAAELDGDEDDIVDAAQEYAEDTAGRQPDRRRSGTRAPATPGRWTTWPSARTASPTPTGRCGSGSPTSSTNHLRQARRRRRDPPRRLRHRRVRAGAASAACSPSASPAMSGRRWVLLPEVQLERQASPWCGVGDRRLRVPRLHRVHRRAGSNADHARERCRQRRVQRIECAGTSRWASTTTSAWRARMHITLVVGHRRLPGRPRTSPSPTRRSRRPATTRTTSRTASSPARRAFDGGLPSRLRQSSPLLFVRRRSQTTVRSVTNLDNNPLWRFIPPNYGPGETDRRRHPELLQTGPVRRLVRQQLHDGQPGPGRREVAHSRRSRPTRDRVLALLTRASDPLPRADVERQPINANLSTRLVRPTSRPGAGAAPSATASGVRAELGRRDARPLRHPVHAAVRLRPRDP